MNLTHHPNGTTNGFQLDEADAEFDAEVDSLYSWWAPDAPTPLPEPEPPAPPACPEALFSLTLKGKLDGIETLLTVRGQTPEEFQRNLATVRGLLDAPAQPPVSQRQWEAGPGQESGWCAIHQCEMTLNTKEGRQWWSHFDQAAGRWCKGKGR